MLKRLFFPPIAACLILACSARQGPAVDSSAQTPEAQRSLAEIIKEQRMSAEDVYKKVTLENGLELYLVQKTEVPLVTVMLAVRNGAFVETPDLDGLAHLYEHMFFKANAKIPSQRDFIDRLDELGVELGAHANATTTTEVVRYFMTVQSKLLPDALEFMSDAIKTPLFLQDELERERKIVASEFDRFESSPQQVFFSKGIMGRLFETYFSHKNIIGNREIIDAATREQMQFMRETYYVPNNSALILVGDFEEEKTVAAVKRFFGDWERGADPFATNPAPQHPALTESVFFNEPAKVTTSSVTKAFHGPSLTQDNKGVVALQLVQDLLSFESSPFRKELIDSGLASSAYFYIWPQRFTSPIFFSVESEPEKIQLAAEKLDELIGRMLQGNFFSQEDLDMAKTNIQVQSAYQGEVGSSFANMMAFFWSSMGELDLYLNYPQHVERIQLEDLDRALQTYVRPNQMVAGALIPEAGPEVQFRSMAQGGRN